MNKFLILLFTAVLFLPNLFFAQNNPKTDSLLQTLLKDNVTPTGDEGLSLIKSGNYEGANTYLSNEISKDESDRASYFKRGVANWALSDTLNACRDWSAVLALGDTEMFNLLDSKCHGSMIIADDTIPSKQYRKMWARNSNDASSAQNAKTVVDEMPSFPGGEQKLFEYISTKKNLLKGNSHGTVYVNFLINPKGKILYPFVSHGIGKEYDQEAIRLIRNMPAWKPGKQKGKPVYVRSSLPVRF
jgi:hypothetical protein